MIRLTLRSTAAEDIMQSWALSIQSRTLHRNSHNNNVQLVARVSNLISYTLFGSGARGSGHGRMMIVSTTPASPYSTLPQCLVLDHRTDRCQGVRVCRDCCPRCMLALAISEQ